MKLRTLISDGNGGIALHRFGATVAMGCLSSAFVKETWARGIDSFDYLGYSVAMAVCYAPVLGLKLLYALKGKNDEKTEGKEV